MKNQLANLLSSFSPRLFFLLAYFHNRGKLPNLKNPQDLSEIWIKKVLNGEINKYYYLADKFKVRNFIEEKGYSSLLTPLLGLYQSVDDIDFSILPNRFALKANYGAGMNLICCNKNELNIEKSKQLLKTWLVKKNYSNSERHYNLITPRIVCEAFIDDGTGGFPIDYKFMCIRGKVICILACSERESGHAEYLPYSIEWEPLYHYCKNYNPKYKIIRKPDNLNEMIKCAEILSSNIDLVRVDLYSNNSRIWFGEMTLTPAGCIFHRWSQRALNELGAIYRNHNNLN